MRRPPTNPSGLQLASAIVPPGRHTGTSSAAARSWSGANTRATDYLELHAASLTALAEVLDRAGRPNEAGSAADEAARIFEPKGEVVSAQRARALGQAFAGA